MARYRKVSTVIWNDAKFRTLSDDAQLVFLFILTHPHMTSLGGMRATIDGLAAEKGWKKERFSKAFREASGKGLVQFDEGAACLVIPNFLKHNEPESPNVIRSWDKALDLIPECDLKVALCGFARTHVASLGEGFRKALESLGEAFRKSMPNQEQEQEQEQEHTPEAFGKACAPGKAKGVHYPKVFDTPDVRAAIDKWGRYYREKKGEPFSAMMQEALLAESLRKRWSPERLVNNIVGSIGKGWQTVNDVDDRPTTKAAASGSPKPGPEYQVLAPPPRRRPEGRDSA